MSIREYRRHFDAVQGRLSRLFIFYCICWITHINHLPSSTMHSRAIGKFKIWCHPYPEVAASMRKSYMYEVSEDDITPFFFLEKKNIEYELNRFNQYGDWQGDHVCILKYEYRALNRRSTSYWKIIRNQFLSRTLLFCV